MPRLPHTIVKPMRSSQNRNVRLDYYSLTTFFTFFQSESTFFECDVSTIFRFWLFCYTFIFIIHVTYFSIFKKTSSNAPPIVCTYTVQDHAEVDAIIGSSGDNAEGPATALCEDSTALCEDSTAADIPEIKLGTSSV